jgi:serine/threonine-protein kinase
MSQEPWFVPPGYQVHHVLGSGQTSHVYLASHDRWGMVALKLPRASLQEQPLLRRMFENEVQITLSLGHQNAVAAFEGHPTGSKAFLALEYCEGGTLDQMLLERGILPLPQAVRLIREVAAGLEQCHRQQVLHRDVKPANVFISSSGTAKLGDFGTGIYLSDSTEDQVGTAFYMAPEIFEGSRATVSSDIYSLGILAFEVLAGSRPFVGSTVQDLMVAHTSGLPRNLGQYRKELPSGLAAVVSRAMSRDRGRRYGSAAQFSAEFMRAAGVPAEEPQAGKPGRAGRFSVATAADKAADAEFPASRGVFGWFRKRG